jgi:hypothetical protein
VLFGPGTVPVTGLVGADVAGEAIGEVAAGSFAVVPGCEQAARPKSAPAIGTMSASFLIIVILTFWLGPGNLLEADSFLVNASLRTQFRDNCVTVRSGLTSSRDLELVLIEASILDQEPDHDEQDAQAHGLRADP